MERGDKGVGREAQHSPRSTALTLPTGWSACVLPPELVLFESFRVVGSD